MIKMSVLECFDSYMEDCKSKSSDKARKSWLTRSQNQCERELSWMSKSRSGGLYLGEPIEPQIRSIENEIIAIKKVRKNLFNL